MDNYRVIRKVGSGNYAQVFLAVHESTGKQVALKLIEKQDTTPSKISEQAREEVANMRKLRHPSVVELHESFDTETHHVLVLEYVPRGELFDYVWEKQGLGEDEARKIFSEVVEGVRHCHENSIVHRDIKLENIMLSRAGHPKLTDFGFSKEFHPDERISTYCGSPLYASPEVVLGRPYMGPECDVWSLGVVLYAMLTASMPFDDRNIQTFVRNIEGGEYPDPMAVSEMARDLISQMLTPSATSRITIKGILSHPWLRSGSTRKISMNMANCQRKSITLCYSKSEATEITRKLAEMSVASVQGQELEDSVSSEKSVDPQWMTKNTSNCSSGYGSGEEEEEEEEEESEEDLVLV